MFASKQLVSSPNSSSLHLPAVSKTNRQRCQHSPDLSFTSMASATTKSTNVSENVSALKAKYIDYAMWLKASSKQNREPIFTHELLKHSLCQMGIDTIQAEQLVSTCTWYVYQFQKELEVDNEQRDPSITTETKLSHRSSRRRHKKTRTTKSKKTIPPRENSSESATTVTSINKESIVSSGSSPSTRNKFSVLPAIQSSEHITSPRYRRVDFNNERSNSQFMEKEKPSHWRSAILKARILPKLRPSETDSSIDNHHNITPESTPIDLDLSSSQKTLHQHGLTSSHNTRSILRKQISSCSSVISTEVDSRRYRSRILTPTSTILDEIPLGTRSQRLFGGSECFAEIMNELEQQKIH
ncbi:unnamed protein product [Rotaria sp. Silwood2]|nr:unnamed protein product [Rotaria sp. Silwood2]CAF2813495.1 unnamed protein product [Rotaria sp. Silwood2]CAF3065202.1 unnamed protein product [Rotaria sp. Silwood2]CAF3183323.1 unnamed protein product [Rotaria sp. Silwood2]CAF3981414.1 unnamed protein product [Rotaria sp. Silwood2]